MLASESQPRYDASQSSTLVDLRRLVLPDCCLTYDALREWRGERADVEYARILHPAATTMEANVDSVCRCCWKRSQPFDYTEVRDLAEPKPPEAPALALSGKPDLKIYDRLLTGSLAVASVYA